MALLVLPCAVRAVSVTRPECFRRHPWTPSRFRSLLRSECEYLRPQEFSGADARRPISLRRRAPVCDATHPRIVREPVVRTRPQMFNRPLVTGFFVHRGSH